VVIPLSLSPTPPPAKPTRGLPTACETDSLLVTKVPPPARLRKLKRTPITPTFTFGKNWWNHHDNSDHLFICYRMQGQKVRSLKGMLDDVNHSINAKA